MNNTYLKCEYAKRSSAYNLPDDIELALENDYAKNHEIYTDNTFKNIQALFLVFPEVSASQILDFVNSS